ncbi:hypothetical protein C2S53_020283 [Perilla frutescens var. hirtella]|uniref:Tyrosinase copper-binding domain-containing protein n=1 Tax=Perilla frutescens var. hirtella TaxID=608512 RepID=A0AAD4JP69_PERFH|nr:hypothetical protein C2S53_020283 [Perilla frutescens var. hirtella]
MASQLHVSSTIAPSSSQLRRSTHPLLSKPSHFSTQAKNNRRLCVSCSDGGETSSNAKVDRRNMLLGLSGLYGAANLISTPGASALPIPAPPLDKCNPNSFDLNTQTFLDFSCCLTGNSDPTNIKEFKLPPPGPKLRKRRAAHRLTDEEINKYKTAVDIMKQLPTDDPRSFSSQANIHCAYCNLTYHYDQPDGEQINLQVHNSWIFFPFHRWYLYFYERILGSLIKDPDFALPFWNWDNPKGMSFPQIFNDPASALYDAKRNQANTVPTAVIDLSMTGITDPLQAVSNNLTVMYNEMIRGNANACDFMGRPLRRGTPPSPGPGASERGSHTAAHAWVGDRSQNGQDMGNFYSAGRDPVFYSHHSNVDRMWSLWQAIPTAKLNFENKKIMDLDFLDASFLFFDENGDIVRVSVKDCVDDRRMGYEYERVDLPWLDYRPPPQTALAKVKRAATSAKSANKVFPVVLDKIVRVIVPKTKKGKADELLVIENIQVDTTKLLKFDVFVNDEDDDNKAIDKASYAGTYAQLPHKSSETTVTTSIRLKLTDLYEDMDVEDDDTVLVTLVPRHEGPGVTIGGIKIIENPTPTAATDHYEC